MFPVTADSGECLPRQTMRLCSSEPFPTPCLCVRIGNISPLPRARERESKRERERERSRHHPACPKFIPAMPDPADRFLRSSRNAARSIGCASLADYSSSDSSPIVLRCETFGNWVRSSRSTRTICRYWQLRLHVQLWDSDERRLHPIDIHISALCEISPDTHSTSTYKENSIDPR